MFVTEVVVFLVRILCVFCPPVFCVKYFSSSPLSDCCYCYFNVQYNAYFSRSVFGPGGSKKKIVSEEIIETIEDTYETNKTDPSKKRARISCDANSKSGTQVSVLFISYFIKCHVARCGNINLLLHGLFYHSSFILAPTRALINLPQCFHLEYSVNIICLMLIFASELIL